MAEKAARLFCCVWAVAAAIATAVPAVPLLRPQPSAVPVQRERPAGVASNVVTRVTTVEPSPEVVEDALLARLAHAQSGLERCELCGQLPASDDPRVTYAITTVFEQTHLRSVRACAAEALSRQPTAEARSWLFDLVDDPQIEVQRAALSALAKAEDAATRSVVIEATHSEDPEIRLSATLALLEAKRPEGFPAATLVLPQLEDHDDVLALIDALGESRDAQTVPTLLALLEGGERESRTHAIAALGEIGSPLALPALESLLARGSTEELSDAAAAMRKLAPDSLDAQLRALLGSNDEARRARALSELFESKSIDAVALMHEQLRSGDEARQSVVVQRLSKAPDASFKAELDDLAAHSDGRLQYLARAALGRLDANGNPKAVASGARRSLLALARNPTPAAQAELLQLLENPELQNGVLTRVLTLAPASTVERVIARSAGFDLPGRLGLISGLARRAEPRFAPELRAALNDSDAEVRDAALRGLVELGDPAAAQDLSRLVRADSAGDRSRAVDLLTLRTDDAATREIATLAQDSNLEVAVNALRSLATRAPELASQLALRAYHAGDGEQRASLLANLNGLNQSVLRPVSELALADADESVASAAVQALTGMEGPASAQRLLALASDTQRSTELRASAALALRQLGGPLARSNRGLLDALAPNGDPGEFSCDTSQ